MKSTSANFFSVLLFFLSGIFTGCSMEYILEYILPMENLFINKPYEIVFTVSNNSITKNEPFEVTIRLCYKELEENTVYAMRVFDNARIEPLEGNLLESNDRNALILGFVEPDAQTEYNEDEPYASNPYCKFRVEFLEAGTYELCVKRVFKDFDYIDFSDGCLIRYRINVR